MTSRHYAVSAYVFVALNVFVLSACGGEKPSVLPVFTPSPSTSASSSPTSTSKWTPEQQQVIDGYKGFTALTTAFRTKAEKIDKAKFYKVAKGPFAIATMKNIDATLAAGFVDTGKIVDTVSAVTLTGDRATLRTCVDQTRAKYVNRGNPSAPVAESPPPTWVKVSLTREADSWLVTGLKAAGERCVSG